MRGQQGGLKGERGGGADRDSKWWLSIDLCTKCNYIGGGQGAESPPPSGYATEFDCFPGQNKLEYTKCFDAVIACFGSLLELHDIGICPMELKLIKFSHILK